MMRRPTLCTLTKQTMTLLLRSFPAQMARTPVANQPFAPPNPDSE